jgi:hypothetical protein
MSELLLSEAKENAFFYGTHKFLHFLAPTVLK